MKKLFYLILVIVTVSFTLFSCNKGDGDNNGEQSGNNGSESPIIWTLGTEITIVTDEEALDSEIAALSEHLIRLTGTAPKVSSAVTDAEHKLVIGEFDCAISDTAYNKLDRYADLFSIKDQGKSAYVIYAEGGSLAVAYSDNCARDVAISYICSNLTEQTYRDSGTVRRETFNTFEFIGEYRDAQREPMFAAMTETLSESAVNAIRNVYMLYDEDLYIWLANLYDPDIGGFYYSASGRDNDGFLPDIESTVQALNILENSGLAAEYGDKWVDMLSEQTKAELLAFTRGLQSEKDGYFYHPQWGTTISKSRRGRDAGWARELIEDLGEEPYYTYAADRISATSGSLYGKLGASSVMAVSKVVATAAKDPELKSEAAFVEYLDGMNFKTNSYSAANTLNSRISEIRNAGLWNVLRDYLTEHQYDNGLWEPEVSYNSINGLMKLSTFFGNSFPKAEKALESTLKIMTLDMSEEVETLCYVYNPWVAVYNLLGSCSAEKEEEFRKILNNRATELITKTMEKLSVFKKNDGGFSMNPDTSSPTSQGELVAVYGSAESDVNATGIAISSVLKYMLRVYRVSVPDIYCKYDAEYFLELLEGLGTPLKGVLIVEDPTVETFDDYDEAEGQEIGGVVKYPASSIRNNVGDEDSNDDGSFKWFTSQIVENPAPDHSDNVLYVGDFVYDKNGDGKIEDGLTGESKEMATAGSSTEFTIVNAAINGNCYILDLDMYFVSSGDKSNPAVQIAFTKDGTADNSVVLDMYSYTRYGKTFLRIAEDFTGADGIKDTEVVGGIPAGEWFNLRVEVYKEYDDQTGDLLIKIKIYVNGEYAGCSDSGYRPDGSYVDRTISSVKLLYYRHSASAFYINNVYAAKASQEYKEETVGASGTEEIDSEKTVYDFENGIVSNEDYFTELFYKDSTTGEVTAADPADWTDELEEKYGIGTKKGGVRYYQSTDPKSMANKVLKVYTWNSDSRSYNSTVYINDSVMSAEGTTYEVEFDYYFEELPWLFAQDYFTVEFQNAAGSKLMGLTFAAKEIPDTNKNQSEIIIKKDDGTIIEGFTLKKDQWYTLKFEYYYNTDDSTRSRLKIYLLDSEDEYTCIYDDVTYTKSGYISQLGLVFTSYKIRGVQYFDGISFAKTDKAYQKETVVNGDSVDIKGESRGAVLIDDSGVPEDPEVNANRGQGAEKDKSEQFADMTELPDSSADATTVLPTVGVSDSNTLEVKDVDGDRALKYTRYTDGAETRFQFIGQNISSDLVFETDIKFDYLPEGATRGLTFIGTKSVGGKGSVWGGSTMNVEYDETVGGYVIKAAGGSAAIHEGVWMNIRLEFDGLTSGSAIRLYVNGVLISTSSLTADIVGIKSYELLAYSGNSSAGFTGTVAFDNTYFGDMAESLGVQPDDGEGDGEDATPDTEISGEDMDGDGGWAKN